MGLLHRLRNAFTALITRTQPQLSWGPARTHAGVKVTADTALTFAAVWACVQVICSSVAQMGWHVYRPMATGRGRERVTTHPADWLLDIQPSPDTNAFNFREAILQYALLWGNGYAEIEHDFAGRPVWLHLIEPWRVNVDRDLSGRLVYDITNQGQPNTVLSASDMFHLKGLGDGVTGLSVVAYARNSIGLGLAAEKFGSRFFKNGGVPSSWIEYPGNLDEKGKKGIAESFFRDTGGDNAHSMVVLDNGLKLHPAGIPLEDAQLLESRTFQVLEICRWFNVRPHKIAELSRATFSNVEEQNIEHVTDTCMPWIVRLEQEANVKLFGAQNRQRLYTKMNIASLLRGKLNDRYAAYATGRQWGWLSVNDVRAWEDLNPLPEHLGDVYLVPANMYGVPLDPNKPMIGIQPQSPPPTPPDDEEDRLRALLIEQVKAAARNGHTNGALSHD